MKAISDFISVIGPAQANLTLSCSVYDKEAIQAASYAFTGNYHVLLTSGDNNSVTVIFELKNKDSNNNIVEDITEFANAIVDHQLRRQLEQENGKIRDLIVAHAFATIDLNNKVNNL